MAATATMDEANAACFFRVLAVGRGPYNAGVAAACKCVFLLDTIAHVPRPVILHNRHRRKPPFPALMAVPGA